MALTQKQREAEIERYARGAAGLRKAVDAAPEQARRWRPSEKGWSIHEIVCHCADAELNAASRIRYLVAEKEPLIVGYDQENWARALDYAGHPLDLALAMIEAVRAHTESLLRRLPDAAWRKCGRHTEVGAYSAEEWLRIYAEHLEKHARQIIRNLDAWRAQTVLQDESGGSSSGS